jgi:hypothetical protein
MEDAAYYLSESVIALAFLCVAAGLLHRSLRTQAAPERLLGATFLLWGLSYPLYVVPEALGVEELVMAPFANASRISWQVGSAMLALFVKKAFRDSDPLATWLVGGVAALLVCGGMGSVWVGDYGGDYPLANPFWWLEWVGGGIPLVWITMEASVYYAKLRQHRWLGEGDALLCNRMGLWCIVGVFWVMVECVTATQYFIYEATQRWLDSLGFAVAALELSAVAMIWLVFYPPDVYRRWVNRVENSHPRTA